MLLKSKDDIDPQLAQLDELLRLPAFRHRHDEILREKRMLQAGFRAEKNAAYQIDFAWKDHANWVVIHDLRLEHKGRVAQIDHLMLHPSWDFYVVETKGINTLLNIEPGQWSFVYKDQWRGLPNPVEQNARDIDVLRELLKDQSWLPRTMGIPVVPRFINVILVPPECLLRKQEELTWVLHMDEFVIKARKDIHLRNLAINFIHNHAGEDARALGIKLVHAHRPFQLNYRKRFGIAERSTDSSERAILTSERCCEECEKPTSEAEIAYCHQNNKRFAGKRLCRKCQSYAPPERGCQIRRP